MAAREAYIVRQPIHDRNGKLVAYEVMYVDGDAQQSGESSDMAAARAIDSLLMEYRDEHLLRGKDVYVNVTPALLARNIPEIFDPARFVVQIDELVLLDEEAMELVRRYRERGYRVALKGFEFNSRYLSALDHVDIVKMNYGDNAEKRESVGEVARGLGKKIVAFNVNTQSSYERATAEQADLFEGIYLGTLLPKEVKRMRHLESSYIALLQAVSREKVDFEEIEKLISRDVTLTYAILRLVNSAYYAQRHRTESIRAAIVVLGINQLRQWIYLLGFQDLGKVPAEFIETSFLRANMCSELAPYVKDLEVTQGEAYLIGMFSTLGSLLETSLEEALEALNLSDAVTDALLYGKGRAGKLYGLILRYEEGDWVRMGNDAEELGIPGDLISKKYTECTRLINKMRAGLLEPRS